MAQQILDCDRPSERLKYKLRLAGLIPPFDAHLRTGKLRDVCRYWIIKPELAVLHQHHRSHGGDWLRHRVKSKNGIRAHRQFGCDIAHAEILVENRFAVLLDQQYRARNFSARDFVGDVGTYPREAIGCEIVRGRGWRLRSRDPVPPSSG